MTLTQNEKLYNVPGELYLYL